MKPPLDTLGPCAQLTVYEHALRAAQQTIDELREKVRKLEGELAASRKMYSKLGTLSVTHSPIIPTAQREIDPKSITEAIKRFGRKMSESVPPHACHPAQRVPVVPEPHEL